MSRPTPRFKDAHDVLGRHGVDFVVVGGVAAVLAGAPISTFDPTSFNRTRRNGEVIAALRDIDARYRTTGVLRP